MEPIVISQSTDEPITLAEGAANLHIDPDCGSPPGYFEATRIQALITAARIACENDTKLSLVAKTLQVSQEVWHSERTRHHQPHHLSSLQWSHHFPGANAIELPNGPVRSIAWVKYLDGDGADTTLDPGQYRTTLKRGVTWLIPAYGVAWPAARHDHDSVRVQYAAGYPSTDSPPETVPMLVIQAMHLYISHWFRNREAVDSNQLAELSRWASKTCSGSIASRSEWHESAGREDRRGGVDSQNHDREAGPVEPQGLCWPADHKLAACSSYKHCCARVARIRARRFPGCAEASEHYCTRSKSDIHRR